MTLTNKIKQLYPEIMDNDFIPGNGCILVQDDSDGNGPYIAKWEHPTLFEPTQEQLAAFTTEEPLQ